MLDLLSRLSKEKPVYVELGLQTSKKESVAYINRCYDNTVFETAVKELDARRIPVIVHCILGLPYETLEDMQRTIDYVCALPVHGIKLQLLHILKGTRLATEYNRLCDSNAFSCMEREAYLNTVATLIARIPKNIVLYTISCRRQQITNTDITEYPTSNNSYSNPGHLYRQHQQIDKQKD